MEKLPTIEELLEKIVTNEEWGYENYYDFAGQNQKVDTQLKLTKQLAIEFAKLHVEAALKQASEEAKTTWVTTDFYDNTKIVSKSSILNSYPLTNIK